jgi:hypothetical protein
VLTSQRHRQRADAQVDLTPCGVLRELKSASLLADLSVTTMFLDVRTRFAIGSVRQ